MIMLFSLGNLVNRAKQVIAKRLIFSFQTFRVYFYKALSNNQIIGKPKRIQPVQSVGRGTIYCDQGVKIGYFPSPYFLSTYAYLEARNPSASIKIGKNTHINNNASIISEYAGVTIGHDCIIGVNVEIIDSDFHTIKVEDRQSGIPPLSKPVAIGNNVFLGSNVKILKGVSIGDGATIANGSVVTKDIPSRVIAGGIPAKIINVLG